MPPIIRPVTVSDKPEWLRLRLLLWPDATVDSHQKEMEECLQSDQFGVLVAEETPGHLIGFLESSIRYYAEYCESRNVGYVEGWYVESEWRRKGIGAELVRGAEEWARSKGCIEMASDCEPDNEISRASHLALDYREAGRSIHFVKQLLVEENL